MTIEILGTGCPKCRALEENAARAAREAGVQADIVKVTDIEQIMNRGVMLTPALAVNGVVKSAGRVLGVDEIKEMIRS